MEGCDLSPLMIRLLESVGPSNYHPDLEPAIQFVAQILSSEFYVMFSEQSRAPRTEMDDLLRQCVRTGPIQWLRAWQPWDDRVGSNLIIELIQIAANHHQPEIAIWLLEHRVEWINQHHHKTCYESYPKNRSGRRTTNRSRISNPSKKILLQMLARADLSQDLLGSIMLCLKQLPNLGALDQIGLEQLARIPNWDVHPRVFVQADDRQLQSIMLQKRHLGQSNWKLWVQIVHHGKKRLTRTKICDLLAHVPIDNPEQVLSELWSLDYLPAKVSQIFILATQLDVTLHQDLLIAKLTNSLTNINYATYKGLSQFATTLEWLLDHYSIDLLRGDGEILLGSDRHVWPILHEHTLGGETVLWFSEAQVSGCIFNNRVFVISSSPLDAFDRWRYFALIKHVGCFQFDCGRNLFVYSNIVPELIDPERKIPIDSAGTFSCQWRSRTSEHICFAVDASPIEAFKDSPLLDGIKHAMRMPKGF